MMATYKIGEMQKIKIGIVDDHPVILNGLKAMLSCFNHFDVVYIATQSTEVCEQLKKTELDVLFLDIQMPNLDGIELTKIIHKAFPDIKIIVFTCYEYSHYVKQVIRNGAVGYLIKNVDHKAVSEAIEQVMKGEVFIDRNVEKMMIRESITEERLSNFTPIITKRELEILKLIAEEHSSQEIANMLSISLKTVDAHRYNLTLKLGVKTRAGLTKEAQRRGFLD